MLGKAFRKTVLEKGDEIISIARSGADINIDISHADALLNTLNSVKPEIIVNTDCDCRSGVLRKSPL